MSSSLIALQDVIVEKLLTCPELNKFRILKEECLNANDSTICGNTTSIVVKIPFPNTASSAYGNFNFSQIAISIEINSPRLSAGNIYSPLEIAEHISKTLHSWQATSAYGQCTLSINPQSPWSEYLVDAQNFSLSINFISQIIA
ncbi:MAG: hypothetical protein R3Y46_01640 [Opitutales bacterium]